MNKSDEWRRRLFLREQQMNDCDTPSTFFSFKKCSWLNNEIINSFTQHMSASVQCASTSTYIKRPSSKSGIIIIIIECVWCVWLYVCSWVWMCLYVVCIQMIRDIRTLRGVYVLNGTPTSVMITCEMWNSERTHLLLWPLSKSQRWRIE